MMIKAIAFDCWNTLFESKYADKHPFERFANRIDNSMEDYHYRKKFESHLMTRTYEDLREPIKQLLKELKIPPSEELLSELKGFLYKAINNVEAFPETIEVLQELKKDYKLGLITNAFSLNFPVLQKEFGIYNLFDVTTTSFDENTIKPDPKMFIRLTAEFGLERDEILIVGDNLQDDILPAKKMSMKSLLIDRDKKHLDYPDRIESLREVKNYL